jgi:lambda family phage tail tape measure protein
MTTNLATLGVEVQTKGAAQSAQQLGQFTNAAKGAATAADTLENQLNATSAAQARAASTTRPLSGAMDRIGAAFDKNAFRIQNTSFQLSDLVVQMEMGVPASRALGQQLPQLLGGFGPLGAVVGVAVGALLSFAPALFGAAEETGALDAAIKELGASTDELILKADALRFGVDEDQVLIFRRLNELLVERAALETQADAVRQNRGIGVGPSLLVEQIDAENFALQEQIRLNEYAKRQLEELEAPKKGADKLAMLEAENALMRVQVEFGKESTEFAMARAEAELKAFEATLSTANEASGLNDKLRAAFIEGQNLSELDIASGLGAAANEASRMANELARAASNAISAAANASRARREAEIKLKFAGDPAGQAGAMFDLGSGMMQGSSDMGVQMQFASLRQETVDNAAATAEAQAQLAAFNETLRSSGGAAAKVDQEMAKLTETFDPFQKVLEGVAGTIESELNSAFASVLDGTSTLSEALLDFASNVLAQVAQDLFAQQFSKPIAEGIAGIFAADGRVFNSAGVTAFANGGVVGGPTIFPFANGVGLMGEAGPEAIMPLARGADGKLGVAAANGNSAPNVTINNYSGQEATASSDSAGNLVIEIGRAIAQDIASGGPSYRAIRTTFGLGNRLQQRG